MQILLPPSESKNAPSSGRPLDLTRLCFADELTPARRRMLATLEAVSSQDDGAQILGVPGRRSADAIAVNRALRFSHAAPAISVFSGVLYSALDHATLDATSRRRAARRVLIFSALFGVVRSRDPIPLYRLSGNATLPEVGKVSAYWRSELGAILDDTDLIIDCRSSTYVAMWRPRASVPVRVFREVDGERSVVTHMAKHARGLVARALLQVPRAPSTPEKAVEQLQRWFGAHSVTTATGAPVDVRVELGAAAAGPTIDVVTS